MSDLVVANETLTPVTRSTPYNPDGSINFAGMNYLEALNVAGLNYKVKTRPLYYFGVNGDYIEIPNKVGVVREDNDILLSEISIKDNIIQNSDALSIMDDIMKNTGGIIESVSDMSKAHKAGVFGVIQLPNTKIVNDDVAPRIIVGNYFDGGPNIQVFFSPVRVFCANQLAGLAGKTDRIWKSSFQIEDAVVRDKIIKDILQVKDQRLNMVEHNANKLVNVKLPREDMVKLLDIIFPIDEDVVGRRVAETNTYYRDNVIQAYNREDLDNFRDTAWGVYNAFADFASHTPTYKEYKDSDKYNELNIKRILSFEGKIKVLEQLKSLFKSQYYVTL